MKIKVSDVSSERESASIPRINEGWERRVLSVPDESLELRSEIADRLRAPSLTKAQVTHAEVILARFDATRHAAAFAGHSHSCKLVDKNRERMDAFELRTLYRREQGGFF